MNETPATGFEVSTLGGLQWPCRDWRPLRRCVQLIVRIETGSQRHWPMLPPVGPQPNASRSVARHRQEVRRVSQVFNAEPRLSNTVFWVVTYLAKILGRDHH